MSDLTLEIIRVVILTAISFYLWMMGRQRAELSQKGWQWILTGFALLLFGSVLDVTDNYESLNAYQVIGNTPTEAFLEKLVGYLGGFLCLAVGLIRWIPTVTSFNQVQSYADKLSQKNVELAIARGEAEAEIVESQERIRSFFKLSLVGFFISIPDEGFVEVNDKFCEMFGYSREALRHLNAKDLTHPDDQEASVQGMARIRLGEINGLSLEKRYIRKDGSVLHGRVSVRGVRGRDGEVAFFLGLVEDITEQHQAQEAVVRAERLAAVGTLAGGVAHEFNNINQVVLLNLHLVLQEQLHSTTRRRLETLLKAIQRSASITDSLLSFTRDRKPVKKLCSLNAVIKDTLTILNDELSTAGVELEVKLGEVPPFIMDDGQVAQVLMNLVINANHALMGQSTKRVTIESAIEGENARLQVVDTGRGIPAEHIRKLFDPFFTTKGEHAEKGSSYEHVTGSGLGLSVTHAIIEEHGGSVHVDSEVGVGTTFTITLPMVQAVSARPGAQAEGALPDPPSPGRIIIVDDVEELREAVSAILGTQNYAVVSTGDGAEALRLQSEQPFDVILIDLQMPKMNGRELLKKLSETNADKKTKIIIVTGRVDRDDTLGEFETIKKPFEADFLLQRVGAALRKGTGE